MEKVELYRQVFTAFKKMCSEGKQTCSFNAYCRENGVLQSKMRIMLKDEFQPIKDISGYMNVSMRCSRIYEDFKVLCAEGKQPGTFKSYHESFGITRNQMHGYLQRNRLKAVGLPGYYCPRLGTASGSHRQEIPFEDVIFEEAGFLPCNDEKVITVMVDGHVAVSFPADTDVDVIAKFVRKTRKEADHVGD